LPLIALVQKSIIAVVCMWVTMVGCGGVIEGSSVDGEDGGANVKETPAPDAAPAEAATSTAAADARARCPSDWREGLGAPTAEDVRTRLPGTWVRCPGRPAQFGESDAIRIDADDICPLALDANGQLVPERGKTCWGWAPQGPNIYLARDSRGGFTTNPQFDAEKNSVTLCGDPTCARYARVMP
jgi:hypothetical protein